MKSTPVEQVEETCWMALARLEELRKSLEETIRLLRELEVTGTLRRASERDERLWGPVVDAAAFALEDRPGTPARLLAALRTAIEGPGEVVRPASLERFEEIAPRPGPRALIGANPQRIEMLRLRTSVRTFLAILADTLPTVGALTFTDETGTMLALENSIRSTMADKEATGSVVNLAELAMKALGET